jgi:hypothetical protein
MQHVEHPLIALFTRLKAFNICAGDALRLSSLLFGAR